MTDTRKFLHDLRNPLNNISIHAELARLLVEKNADTEKLAAALDVILRECRQCAELIDGHDASDTNA